MEDKSDKTSTSDQFKRKHQKDADISQSDKARREAEIDSKTPGEDRADGSNWEDKTR